MFGKRCGHSTPSLITIVQWKPTAKFNAFKVDGEAQMLCSLMVQRGVTSQQGIGGIGPLYLESRLLE